MCVSRVIHLRYKLLASESCEISVSLCIGFVPELEDYIIIVASIEFSHAVHNVHCACKLALTGYSVCFIDTVRELLEARVL